MPNWAGFWPVWAKSDRKVAKMAISDRSGSNHGPWAELLAKSDVIYRVGAAFSGFCPKSVTFDRHFCSRTLR